MGRYEIAVLIQEVVGIDFHTEYRVERNLQEKDLGLVCSARRK